MTTHEPGVFSSPAPEGDEEDRDDFAGLTDEERARQRDMEELFAAYGDWCRTRNFYGPPPVKGSVLGRLTKKTKRRSMGPPDAACSAEMSALHLAVIAQPEEALDRKVFSLHFLYNVSNVKAASAELGISRPHWYRLLRAFTSRVVAASKVILNHNLAAADRLQHRGGLQLQAEETDDACEAADAPYRVGARADSK